jgi:hypothetical protein
MHAHAAWSPQRVAHEAPGCTYDAASVAAGLARRSPLTADLAPSEHAASPDARRQGQHSRKPLKCMPQPCTMPRAWETPGGTTIALSAGCCRTPQRSCSDACAMQHQASPSVQLRPWTAHLSLAQGQPHDVLCTQSYVPSTNSAGQPVRPQRAAKPIGISGSAASLHDAVRARGWSPHSRQPEAHTPPSAPPPRHARSLSVDTAKPRPLSARELQGPLMAARGCPAAAHNLQTCAGTPVTRTLPADAVTDICSTSQQAARSLSPSARQGFAGALGDAAHVLEGELSSRRRRSLSARGEQTSGQRRVLGVASIPSKVVDIADSNKHLLGLLDLADMDAKDLQSERSSML